MIRNQIESQFNNLLPYIKEHSKNIIENILQRAAKLDSQGQGMNVEELQQLLREVEKILSLDKKLKKLFSQIQ